MPEYTYIYHISTNFLNGINTSQLVGEINLSNISNQLLRIDINGDDVKIIFTSSLSSDNITILDNLVNSHIPAAPNITPDFFISADTSLIKFNVNSETHKLLGNQTKEIIISKESQSDYSSIKEAIVNNNFPNTIFTVFPGTYVEDNPVILPPGSVLIAKGSAGTTIIMCQNPTSDIIVLSPWCKIYGFTIRNIANTYGSGARGIFYDGTQSGSIAYSSISNCLIQGCDIGAEISGGPDTLLCEMVLIHPLTGPTDKGIYVHGGGQFVGLSSRVTGIPYPQMPVTNGFVVEDDGSKLSLTTSSSHFCYNGLYVNNNGSLELNLFTAYYNNTGLVLGSTGTSSIIRASTLQISDSLSLDFDIQATDGIIQLFTCEIDEELINNPNNVKLNAKIFSDKNNKRYQTMTGDLRIGSVINPSSTAFGEGKYNTYVYNVFSNNNLEEGTWIDNTTSAKSLLAPFDLFQGVTAGNCFYVGFINNIPGVKISITEATSNVHTKDDIIWEYWNGSDWVSVLCMQIEIAVPNYYIIDSFISFVKKQDIYFRIKKTTDMPLKTINNISRRWIRCRIVNDISSIPKAEYIKIHTNSTEIYNDGMIFFYGDARNVGTLYLTSASISASSSTSADQILYLTDTFNIIRKNNKYLYNTDSIYGFITFLPSTIDTSFPLKIRFSFIIDNSSAGDIQWIVNWTYTIAGSSIYNDVNNAPSSLNNMNRVTKVSSISENSSNKDIREYIDIDIDRINPNDPNNDNLLWVFIERNSVNNSSDTYPGSASLVQIFAQYVNWRSGGYLQNF